METHFPIKKNIFISFDQFQENYGKVLCYGILIPVSV